MGYRVSHSFPGYMEGPDSLPTLGELEFTVVTFFMVSLFSAHLKETLVNIILAVGWR